MRRRQFIAALGGAVAWPLAARAQQPDRVRRIGVFMNLAADDPEGQARLAAFLQGLQEVGWAVGRNLRVDIRWRAVGAEQTRKYAAELVALAPDVILAAGGTDNLLALREANNAVPIVFAAVSDPVVIGVVDSLARPRGNITGFASAEYGMTAKSVELLKAIAPGVTRAAVLYEPTNSGGVAQYVALQAVAPLLRVELTPVTLRNPDEIERAIAAFARIPNGGLIVTRLTEAIVHRDLIIELAARHRLPTVYPLRVFVAAGGLISYGPDIVDEHRRAAGYIDRILKGEKPADLPVQAPTKYELAINLKTVKALGLTIPETLLATADEVIE
jgi:putative tryptophan/tyrosine transport system substrate-binding protein